MQHSVYSRLARTLWVFLLVCLLVLAAYVGLGRLAMGHLDAYREPLLDALNERLPFEVDAQQLRGHWRSFSPEIVLTRLRLDAPGDAAPPLQLDEGLASVNILQSLRTRSLQLNHLELRGLDLQGELTREGKLLLPGLQGESGQGGDWLYDFLRNIERVTLAHNSLTLALPSGESRVLDLNLALQRQGSHRRLRGTLVSTSGTQVDILADGVGDPQRPETLTGSAHLAIKTPDLDAIRALMGPGAPPMWSRGSGEIALWLTLQDGEPTVEAEMNARDLTVYSDDGVLSLPLDAVSLRGRLFRENRHWTLFGTDMTVVQGQTRVNVPRIQVDTWESAVRLRVQDVPLAPVNAIATGLSAVPDSLREIFATLAPRGTLPAVQVNIGDVTQPSRDWELEATFEDLAVESFRGAPGVEAARGYAALRPGGGSITLDSRNLSLSFPSIYHNPLAFDEVHGTLGVNWSAEAVVLSSGLLTADGEEGRAHVLFGLDVPLQKTEAGVEMQLLVGLENTGTQFRDKYIPYTLSPGLRQWLADSIGQGVIEQGAFLWRGSLRKDGAPLRTVQLAFNVSDTLLNYHPQWPDVHVGSGQVLIDDAAVSVWSDQATLYASSVQDMSVELRVDERSELQLSIDGRVAGPAEDGLRVVNESPLDRLVGGAFNAWRASGELVADLAVRINLSDKKAAPVVDVRTDWQDTTLHIEPGNLQVEQLSGQFGYASETGLWGKDLAGKLWGRPVALTLQQEHLSSSKGYDPRTSRLLIGASTRLAIKDVKKWLSLDLLDMASGRTDAQMQLAVTPGARPVLRVASQLEGVALDLPPPYAKSADAAQALAVEVELGSKGLPVSIALGEALALNLQIDGGKLASGTLGIHRAASAPEPGAFRITGQVPNVDGEGWLSFLETYFGLGSMLDAGDPGDGEVPAAEVAPPLEVRVEDLRIAQLSLWGRAFDDVTLRLQPGRDAWVLGATATGLRGSAALRRAPAASTVTLDHLDWALLVPVASEDAPVEDGEAAIIKVPPIDLVVENLYRGEQRLGNVALSLRSMGNVLQVKDIVGRYAGLALTNDSPGEILWRQGAQGNTRIDAILAFEDLADTLSFFDYEQILRTEGGELDLQLRWPGSPQDFALAGTEGAILVDIEAGSFPEAPAGAAGALRVVNILNLADIVRRLSLTHMFESGIPFDQVEGEIYLHGGTIEVARMMVEGTSSFQFSGVSDVAMRSLNGELVATLPVANNLPWMAALAASLPVAAGVFVVSKVFDKQMSRLSSAVYAVEGTWDEPVVEFDRIFDDTARAVELPESVEESAREPVSAPEGATP